MCLDAGRSWRDREPVTVYQCEAGNANQAWAVDGDQVKVKDTIGTPTPMCLDAGWSWHDKEPVTLYQCEAGNSDQEWVTDGGQVTVKDTLS